MSIYATLWMLRLPVWVPCTAETMDTWHTVGSGDIGPLTQRWVEVWAQAVPAHIGHPSIYPEGDPYAWFLPPVVEYDPDDEEREWTPRAVIIVDEDHSEKDVQRYPDSLMVLTGAEYQAMKFGEMLERIEDALVRRYGHAPDPA